MGELSDYAIFIAIMDQGSLTAAARSCGRSLQVVSRALARLEDELGVTLINRTTRRLQPTSAGIGFHMRVRAVMAELEAARAEVRRDGEEVSGTLRVGAPAHLASAYLTPLIAEFMHDWPDVRIELVLSDRWVDLLDERLDLTVRIGALPDSGLHARTLGYLRRVLFAAPALLAKHGRPTTIDDLAAMPCVVRTFGSEQSRWALQVDGAVQQIKVDGVFRANDAAICNQAVALGLGVGIAPLWQIRRMLAEGQVELVLTGCEPLPVPVHAVWGTNPLPARARLLVDSVVKRFADELW